jgi:hypothetical protein
MTATLVLSGTSSAGTPPIASKAPTWPLIQSASPIRRAIPRVDIPADFNLITSRTWRIASLSVGIQVPFATPKGGTVSESEETSSPRATSSRNGGRDQIGTVGEIIPESWATPSGISTLDSATELAEIYSRLSGARRPLIDASGPEACSPNEESASDHCDRDVPDIALRYNRNALPVTSCGEVQVCRESGTIRGGADMAAIGTPLKGPTDSPARLAPGAREPRAIADDIAAQLKPVAVARASQ